MLPKPEKIRKIKSLKQLDLVDEISTKDRVRVKQRWLFITLGLTIGISLIFYTYRHFRLPNISIPVPKISTETITTPSFNINNPDKNNWAIYVSSADFIYQKDFPNTATIDDGLNFLNQAAPDPKSFLYEKIPKGVTVRQIISPNASEYKGYFRLTIPNRDIYILFNIIGSNLDNSAKLIPGVVETIYWHLVGR